MDDIFGSDMPADTGQETGAQQAFSNTIAESIGLSPKLDSYTPDAVSGAISDAASAVSKASEEGVSTASQAMDATMQAASDKVGQAKTAAEQAAGQAKSAAESLASQTQNDIMAAAQSASGAAQSIVSAPDKGNALLTAAKAEGEALKDKIRATIADAASQASDQFESAKSLAGATDAAGDLSIIQAATDVYLQEVEATLLRSVDTFTEWHAPLKQVEVPPKAPTTPPPVITEGPTLYEAEPVADGPTEEESIPLWFTFEAVEAPGEFVIHEFDYEDEIFNLPKLDVKLASKNPTIDLNKLLDTPATLTIHNRVVGTRHVSGIISEITRGDSGIMRDIEDLNPEEDLGQVRTFYNMTIVPALHRLSLGSDSKSFRKMAVPDLVADVIKTYAGDMAVAMDISGQHDEREYIVQQNETHLEFIERLMAEEGIWYHFTSDTSGKHTIHICDNPAASPDCPELETLAYEPNPGASIGDFDTAMMCDRFSLKEKLHSTSVSQRDYTFKKPDYNQEQSVPSSVNNGAKADYELYNFPGRYKSDATGAPFTQHKMEAIRVGSTKATGGTYSPHLHAGHVFTLSGHPRDEYNMRYRLLKVVHKGTQPQALEEDAGDTGMASYQSEFEAMPASQAYRPIFTRRRSDHRKITTPPALHGPQLGTVVGPEEEEIYVDSHGRVLVHFNWDRHNEPHLPSSVWVRVAHSWAGNGFGAPFFPRVGTEVIVEFIGGDVDQPIVTGQLYNANTSYPYPLPNHKSRTALRSASYKGEGFNEISFEDEADNEHLHLNAQKFMSTMVNGHNTHVVGGSSINVSRGNQFTSQHHLLSKSVGGATFLIGGRNALDRVSESIDLKGAKSKVIGKATDISISTVIPDVKDDIKHGVKQSTHMGRTLGDADITSYLTLMHTYAGDRDETALTSAISRLPVQGGDGGESLSDLAAAIAHITGDAAVEKLKKASKSADQRVDKSAGNNNGQTDTFLENIAHEAVDNIADEVTGTFYKSMARIRSLLSRGVFKVVAAKFVDITAGVGFFVHTHKFLSLVSRKRIGIYAGENMDQRVQGEYDITARKRFTLGTDEFNGYVEKKDSFWKLGRNGKWEVKNKVTWDVGDEFTIKCGKSEFTMRDDGTIRIKGKTINLSSAKKMILSSTGSADYKAKATNNIKGAKINLN